MQTINLETEMLVQEECTPSFNQEYQVLKTMTMKFCTKCPKDNDKFEAHHPFECLKYTLWNEIQCKNCRFIYHQEEECIKIIGRHFPMMDQGAQATKN